MVPSAPRSLSQGNGAGGAGATAGREGRGRPRGPEARGRGRGLRGRGAPGLAGAQTRRGAPFVWVRCGRPSLRACGCGGEGEFAERRPLAGRAPAARSREPGGPALGRGVPAGPAPAARRSAVQPRFPPRRPRGRRAWPEAGGGGGAWAQRRGARGPRGRRSAPPAPRAGPGGPASAERGRAAAAGRPKALPDFAVAPGAPRAAGPRPLVRPFPALETATSDAARRRSPAHCLLFHILIENEMHFLPCVHVRKIRAVGASGRARGERDRRWLGHGAPSPGSARALSVTPERGGGGGGGRAGLPALDRRVVVAARSAGWCAGRWRWRAGTLGP